MPYNNRGHLPKDQYLRPHAGKWVDAPVLGMTKQEWREKLKRDSEGVEPEILPPADRDIHHLSANVRPPFFAYRTSGHVNTDNFSIQIDATSSHEVEADHFAAHERRMEPAMYATKPDPRS